jgi:uncharacterized membrane protein YkvA (DUF1232 family)
MKKEENKHDKNTAKDPLFTDEDEKKNLPEEELKNKGRKISDSWLYAIFVKSAYRLLQKPLTVFQILKKAIARLQEYETIREFATDTKERLQIIIRMLKAYTKGEYSDMSKLNAALSLAAILYFLSPIDFIPDFLAIGLLDDFALLTWVYYNFQNEIEEFLEWEDDNKLMRIKIKE